MQGTSFQKLLRSGVPDLHKMKTAIKSIFYLQMTALLITATLAGPAALARPGGLAKELPFHGTVEAVETQRQITLFEDTATATKRAAPTAPH